MTQPTVPWEPFTSALNNYYNTVVTYLSGQSMVNLFLYASAVTAFCIGVSMVMNWLGSTRDALQRMEEDAEGPVWDHRYPDGTIQVMYKSGRLEYRRPDEQFLSPRQIKARKSLDEELARLDKWEDDTQDTFLEDDPTKGDFDSADPWGGMEHGEQEHRLGEQDEDYGGEWE